MNLKINLTMDERWFKLIFVALMIIVMFLLIYGRTEINIVKVQEYSNCSVEQKPFSYPNYFTMNCCYHPNDKRSISNPKDCNCLWV